MAKNVLLRDRADAGGVKTIAFVHHKGGTGKTTSCINIAGWLSRMRKKVLVVDLDPQGNATNGLGVERRSLEGSVYDVLFGEKNSEEVILETTSGVYLMPSSIDLLAAEIHLSGQINNTCILKERLEGIEGSFDYVLIDVPPGSTLLMINGIVASQNVIIPLDSGIFSYETLETLKALVLDLSEKLQIEVNIMMILLRQYATTFFDRIPTYQVRKLVRGFLEKNNISSVDIFTIPFSRKVYSAQMRGVPISHYAPYSDAGRGYKRIAKEIVRSWEL